jgi:hypothetical protein
MLGQALTRGIRMVIPCTSWSILPPGSGDTCWDRPLQEEYLRSFPVLHGLFYLPDQVTHAGTGPYKRNTYGHSLYFMVY